MATLELSDDEVLCADCGYLFDEDEERVMIDGLPSCRVCAAPHQMDKYDAMDWDAELAMDRRYE